MSSDIRFLLSLSILIPVLGSIARLKKLPVSYYPIVTIVFLGLLNEVLVYFIISAKANNAIKVIALLNNVYFLLETLLLYKQFRNWKNILKNKTSFYLLTGSSIILWVTDQLFLGKITTYDSLLIIFFPFVLVLLATGQLSFIVAIGKSTILKNAIFVFCMSFILYYSYRVLSEVFWHYAPTSDLKKSIFSIQVYVNVIFNILLGIGILLIPKRRTLSN